jgi:hypothetical protein
MTAAKRIEKNESLEKSITHKDTNLSLDLKQLSKPSNTSNDSQHKSRSKTPISIRSSLNSISSNSSVTQSKSDNSTDNNNNKESPLRKGNKLSDLSSTDYSGKY